MMRWQNSLRAHGSVDWVIVVVESNDSKKKNKANILPRSSILDKIRSDFCNKQNDRCGQWVNKYNVQFYDIYVYFCVFLIFHHSIQLWVQKNKKVCFLQWQMCGSVGPFEGVISVSGFLEFHAAQAANSAPHVLHQEPGTLRRWHAYASGETYPAWLELLRILHGSGRETNSDRADSLHRRS